MCENPIKIKDPNNPKELITVKCGKCILCRRNKCRNWAKKLIWESRYHDKMCMLTLTFKPKFLLRPLIKKLYKTKTVKIEDERTGYIRKKIKKIQYTTMINPGYMKDVRKTGWIVTLFMKKLRKYIKEKYNKEFTMFAVGEHGTEHTHRAHWHIVLFGVDIQDLKGVQTELSKKGKPVYRSTILEMLWSYKNMNCGRATISEVKESTIKYVANYTMKKMYKPKTENKEEIYITTMRFSNQGKIGTKWLRRFHKELRDGVWEDGDGAKYPLGRTEIKELSRYPNELDQRELFKTATIIELKIEQRIQKMIKSGMDLLEEAKKKARKLNYYYGKANREF